ncbi:hypothetical protein M8C21_010517, partial [Ambrosia artemisiifolia]
VRDGSRSSLSDSYSFSCTLRAIDMAPRGRPRIPRPPRQIRYAMPEDPPAEDAEPIPLEDRVLAQHTLLMFEEGTWESDRLQRFLDMPLLRHRTFHWDILRDLGEADRLTEMLGVRWRRALTPEAPQYRELTVEFHSTVKYRSGDFLDPDIVTFSLGRRVHSMSVPTFAIHTGLYTDEEARAPAFEQLLRGVRSDTTPTRGMTQQRLEEFWDTIADCAYDQSVPVTHMRLEEFWDTIADCAYDQSVPVTHITDPLIRYLHRIIACTILARHDGQEKCSYRDLFVLHAIVTGTEVNIATILLTSLAKGRRAGHDVRLEMGPYIGQLAASLGVFDRYPRLLLTLGPGTDRYSLDEMRAAGMCPPDDPVHWSEVPQARQPRRQRQVERSESSAAAAARLELTATSHAESSRSHPPVDSLTDLRDQLFKRIDERTEELRRESRERFDVMTRAIRHMMESQGVTVPAYLQSSDQGASSSEPRRDDDSAAAD